MGKKSSDLDSDSDSDLDSDSDEYIDLSNHIENNLKHIFQFHLHNEKLLIKHIGKSSEIPDIIIMENFGPESNMFLYNCVYSSDELDIKKDTSETDLYFPIIKLIIKHNLNNHVISSIAIKLNQNIVYESEITEWELYWIENSSFSKEIFKTKKLEKNINPTNILENLIKLSITPI